jgi:hypothetical protein
MQSTLKKLTATVALAGAVTVGSLGLASSAFAADGSSGSTGAAATSQTTRHPLLAARVRRAALKIVIDQLGVTAADLRAALKGGQTISQYATSLGKDPKVLADALTTAADNRIDKAVTNGKLDATRAATLKGKVGDRVDHFLNRTWGQKAAAGANA